MNVYKPLSFKGVPVREDDVRVVAYRSPFEQERAETFFAPGITIREIVDRVGAGGERRWTSNGEPVVTPYKVSIYGHEVPPDVWHVVKPKPGTAVVMVALAKGPLGPIFAAIGAAVTGFQTFVAGLGFFGKILMAGLSIGFNMLINALFAPPKPEKPSKPKEGYNFAGSRNQATPFEPIPVCLGYHRVTPVLLAPSYTEDVGDDQYINLKMTAGHGPLQISDIRIADTPITEYEDVEIETREGWPSDTETTIYKLNVIEEGVNSTLEGPPDSDPSDFKKQTRYTASGANKIGLNFYFPQGLIRFDPSGDKKPITTTIKIRYRQYPGGGAWTDRPDLVTKRKTQDPVRVGTTWAVTAGPQYEVEIWRVEAEDDPDDDSGNQIFRDVSWGSIKSFSKGLPVTFTKPLSEIAVRIRATGQLNGTVDQLNCVVKSYVAKSWNGSSWVNDVISQRPHDLFRHVLQGQANARPRTDSQINLTALQNWGTYCIAQGFKYNRPIQEQASVFDTCQRIAAAGRATMVFIDGKWSVVYDDQNPPVVQMFTPRNSWGFEGKHEYIDLPHAFRVQFPNELKRYVQDEIIVYDDGYSKDGAGSTTMATRFEGLDLPGITHPDLAWRHGRFHLAQLRLRPETYQLYTDFEGLRVTRGDRVWVSHDVMLVGTGAGRVTGVSGQYVTFDEEQVLGSAAYTIRFRRANGTFLSRQVVDGQTGQRTMLLLDDNGGTVTTMPSVGDLFTIGPTGNDNGVYRVSGTEPQDDMSVLVYLVDDAPEIDNADTGTIPPFDSNVVEPVDIYKMAPTGLSVKVSNYQQGNVVLGSINFSWGNANLNGELPVVYGDITRYQTQIYDDGVWSNGPSVNAPRRQVTINGLAGDVYRFRVRGVLATGEPTAWATTSNVDLNYLSKPPISVTNFMIATVATMTTLTWKAVLGCTYEIRYVSAGGTVAWNNGITIATGLTATTFQTAAAVGSYMIKAVNNKGVKSLAETIITTNIAELLGLNVVQTLDESIATTGAEQAVNGAFASDVSWTKGASWTISGGTANVSTAAGSSLSQVQSFTPGVMYKVTFTVTSLTNGSITPRFTGGTTVTGTSVNAVGTYTQYLTAATGNTTFNMTVPLGAAVMSIDNVSVMPGTPVFGGAKTDTVVVGGVLKLAPVTGGVASEGYYEWVYPYDLSAVYTSRLSAIVNVVGEDVTNVMSAWDTLADVEQLDPSSQSDWNVSLEMQTSQDNVTFTDWAPFVAGDVTARAFKFRAKLTGNVADGATAATVTPAISTLAIKVDMPDRVVAENNLAVTTSGRTITFPGGAFRGLAGLGIAAQNLATGEYAVISSKTVAGFTIIFRNAGGTAVARTFDYVAKGYGSVV